MILGIYLIVFFYGLVTVMIIATFATLEFQSDEYDEQSWRSCTSHSYINSSSGRRHCSLRNLEFSDNFTNAR
jgi:hypothetical protein